MEEQKVVSSVRTHSHIPVSYTHLDVYKRQIHNHCDLIHVLELHLVHNESKANIQICCIALGFVNLVSVLASIVDHTVKTVRIW